MLDQSKLDAVLASHAKWLADPSTGQWANLSRADLSGADLRWADLSRANLSEANLSEANLRWANLSWADLSKANLSRANLSRANLSKADLSKANLRRADLRGADLGGADLRWAVGIVLGGQPDGWLAYAYLREGVAYVRVGCRCFTFAEARNYWAGKDDRKEVLAAVDYMAHVAALRGWPV